MTAGVPPGPGRAAALAAVPLLLRDPYHYVQSLTRRYGDVVRLPLPGVTLTIVNHPDHVAHFLSKHAEKYVKGDMNHRLEPVLGDGIPISEGDKWRRNRKLMNPMFGRRQLTELTSIMAEAVEERVVGWARWQGTGETVDLDPQLGAITMSVLLRSMFHTAVADEEIDAAVDDFRVIGRFMAGLMLTVWAPRWLPVPYGRSGAAAVERVNGLITRLVAERRTSPRESPDLLNLLLAARFDDGAALSELELRDEIMGLLFGGFETTASALAWTIALLDRHPDIAESMHEEIDALAGRTPTFEDLQSLRWTKACFDEAQRLQGAPLYTRQAVGEDEIGGYGIPPGSIVGVSAFALHRDPRFWKEPERYDPGRFLDATEIDRFQFIPFGGGPRHCIGSQMAYMEAQLTLAAAFQRYRFRMAPGFVPRHDFHLSTGMKGGCPVTVFAPRAA